ELWSTLAAAKAGADYPADDLRDAWRETLTLQFHDIIPGSSIAWVHDDAEEAYLRIGEVLESLRDDALDTLADSVGGDVVLANSSAAPRAEVVVLSLPVEHLPPGAQELVEGGVAVWAEIPALGLVGLRWDDLADAPDSCTIAADGDGYVLSNGLITLTIDG